ncbi:MAG: NADH:flavin oxidoreductase [Ardenticatenales bacterium]|nr:NADH:flavin oxidoreductase [Ardenticatenales bacterium]
MMAKYRRVAQLRTAAQFQAYLDEIGVALAFDEAVATGPDAPLAQSLAVNGRTLSNRFAVLPMEGWDGTDDGFPSELTQRRWRHFGQSGAKLFFGGEAVAVRHDGRANPQQLMISDKHLPAVAALRQGLVDAHQASFGTADDLYIGLQLTHSGRFCRPEQDWALQPQILYNHPFLDEKYHLPDDHPLMSDDEIKRLIDQFIHAAVLVQKAGFDFVDLKHCHGYLGHEFLSAVDRKGAYGGSFENRTRFLREIVAGVRSEAPGLDIGVRLSAFDWIPFRTGDDGIGEQESWADGTYPYAFGGGGDGTAIDLTEPKAFLDMLLSLDIKLVCITGGSPYYNPHIQRPAMFPPSDGYLPPEDPLAGVARQIAVTAELKNYRPELTYVGSGYSYLQDWLPNVAQNVIRTGQTDFVGLGRMMLSYPEMVADVLNGQALQRKRICRTFSDCTTGPRIGLPSGCYPLDDFYKVRSEAEAIAAYKKELKATE